jgi:hypothetical protein
MACCAGIYIGVLAGRAFLRRLWQFNMDLLRWCVRVVLFSLLVLAAAIYFYYLWWCSQGEKEIPVATVDDTSSRDATATSTGTVGASSGASSTTTVASWARSCLWWAGPNVSPVAVRSVGALLKWYFRLFTTVGSCVIWVFRLCTLFLPLAGVVVPALLLVWCFWTFSIASLFTRHFGPRTGIGSHPTRSQTFAVWYRGRGRSYGRGLGRMVACARRGTLYHRFGSRHGIASHGTHLGIVRLHARRRLDV